MPKRPGHLISHWLAEEIIGRNDPTAAHMLQAFGVYSLTPRWVKQQAVRSFFGGAHRLGMIPDNPARYKPGTYQGRAPIGRVPTPPAIGMPGLLAASFWIGYDYAFVSSF